MHSRILHVGKFYSGFQGGIEKVTEDCVRAASDSYISYVFCFSEDESSIRRGENNEIIISFFAKVNFSSQPLNFRAVFALYKLIDRIKPDLIHFHYPNPLLSIPFLFRAKNLVTHYHSRIRGKGFLGFIYSRILEPRLLNISKAIIYTSEAYSNNEYISKSYVLYNAIDESRFVDSKPLPIIDDIPGKTIIFAFGRHVEYKGFDLLINASKFLTRRKIDHTLVIGGDGPLSSYLKNLAQGSKNVIFVGKISDQNLKYLFNSSIGFILSSVDEAEAFGIVLLEALYNRCPIVRFNIPNSGVSYVVPKDFCLEVDQINAYSLSIRIEELIRMSGTQRKELSDRGFQLYQKKFQQNIFDRNLLQIYRNILFVN